MDGRNRCPASRTQARAVVVRRVDIATVAPDDDAVDQHQSSSDRSMPVLGGHCNFRLGRGSLLSGSLTRWRDLFRFRCSWLSIHRHSPTKIIMIILQIDTMHIIILYILVSVTDKIHSRLFDLYVISNIIALIPIFL